jgi:hypothetical protein
MSFTLVGVFIEGLRMKFVNFCNFFEFFGLETIKTASYRGYHMGTNQIAPRGPINSCQLALAPTHAPGQCLASLSPERALQRGREAALTGHERRHPAAILARTGTCLSLFINN